MKKSACYYVLLLLAITTLVLLYPAKLYAYNFTKASIDLGDNYTLVLRHDGTVWAWGQNSRGQLGDGSTLNQYIPVRVSSLTDVVAISAGQGHSMALRSDGTVSAWGSNECGQLGDGSTSDRYSPVQVTGLTNVTALAAGQSHSLALKADGTVWAWGSNDHGQLGDGSNSDSYSPVQVSALSQVIAISAGDSYCLALKSDGTVWTWGWNSSGQLGNGSTDDCYAPVQVSTLANVRAISAGGAHSLALKTDGTVWGWGANNFGQLGDGSTSTRYTPVQISGLTDVCNISAGEAYSMALRINGTAWAWGSNAHGELGDDSTSSSCTPVQVSGLTSALLVAAGSSHSACLKLDGTVWAWGDNSYGQLGNNVMNTRTTPALVSNLTTVTTCLSITGGYAYTSMIKPDGTLWSWGSNMYGKLGDGTTINRSTPVQVGTEQNWLRVSSMWEHTSAIKTDGSLWAWGSNAYGQVGDNTTADRLSPVRIGTDNDWLDVKSGYQHTVALKSDGSLWAWGSNQYGQLGDGTYYNRLTPVRIGTANDWSAIAVGSYHTVAIKQDGSLWAWGDNRFYQLGDGTTLSKNIPTRIGNANDWAAISAATGHTLALKSDCTLWGWGRQTYGELGDGTALTRQVPVQIGTANTWASIKAVWNHTAALKTDGSLWTWGWNSYGQLGSGTNTDALTPVHIGTALDWLAVAGGNAHSLALKRDGSLWTWGLNDCGQLGNGTFSNQNMPATLAGNKAPAAVDDAVTVIQGETAAIDVIANDSDVNGDPLAVLDFAEGAHGVVTKVNNSLYYTPLASFSGSDSFIYQITDGRSGTASATVNVTVQPSPYLQNLTLSKGTLNPTFSKRQLTYTASVVYDVTQITLTPTAEDPYATIKVNGVVVPSGQASAPINLHVGSNPITVEVTSKTGELVATYSITVTRASSSYLINLTAKTGFGETVQFSPTFQKMITAYSANVGFDVSQITITPDPEDPNATVKVNGVEVPTGQESAAIALNVGSNPPIMVEVTSQISGIVRTYSVTITRASSPYLTGLAVKISSGKTITLIPMFSRSTYAYTASVANVVASVLITPTAEAANATITVNTVVVPSGQTSAPISLIVGDNVVNVEVISGTGVDRRTYTIVINRRSAIPANNSPIAVDDSATVNENESALINVLANDSDADGDTLSINIFSQGSHGTVAQEGTSLRYTPAANYYGTDSFTYQIVDGKGGFANATVYVTINDVPFLANMVVNTWFEVVPLSPTFDKLVTAYTANVGYDVTQITITPTADAANTTVTVNGITVPDGQTSSDIALNVGENPVTVEVTSNVSGIKQTYTLALTRASNPYLTSLLVKMTSNKVITLTPMFTPSTYAYTASVTNAVASVLVTPTASDGVNAIIKVNGVIVESNTSSAPISLVVGDNTITVEVTSGVGGDKRTYTITITRRTV